jgi:hypothetical protein
MALRCLPWPRMINFHHAKHHSMSALGDRIATAVVTATEQQSAAHPAERARWGGIAGLLSDCQTRPAADLFPRINATIQGAIGGMENATMQAEHIRWKSLVRLLEDIPDAIGKQALHALPDPTPPSSPPRRLPKLGHLISGKRA